MSADGSSNLESLLTCSLCQSSFLSPKLLPCLHSFCRDCLCSYLKNDINKSQETSASPDSFICPECQASLVLPSHISASNLETCVDELPDNFLMQNVLGTLSMQRSTRYCDRCIKTGSPNNATACWCKECGKCFCEECSQYHSRSIESSTHTILNIDVARQQSLKSLALNPPCPHHEQELIILFCVDHDSPCCSKCVTESHAECETVETADDVMLRYIEENEIGSLLQRLQTLQQTTEVKAKDGAAQSTSLIDEKDKICRQIEELRAEVNTKMDTMCHAANEQLDQLEMVTQDKILQQTKKCDTLRSCISNATKLLKVASECGSNGQMLITIARLKSECVRYEQALLQLQSETDHIKLHFIKDDSFQKSVMSLTHIGETAAEGNVSIPVETADSAKVAEVPVEAADNRIPADIIKVEEIRQFSARVVSDRHECHITGGTYLKDGRILLCDSENKKYKLFSEEGGLLCELSARFTPHDITALGRNNYAASHSSGHIKFLSLTDNELNTLYIPRPSEAHYYGISYTGKSIVAACPYTMPAGAHFIGATGRTQGRVVCEIDLDEALDLPLYLAAVKNTTNVYIGDGNKDAVCNVSHNGNISVFYKHKDLVSLRGVAVDLKGNVYACGKDSGNVHQISPQGDTIRILLSRRDGLGEPCAIAFQENGACFFVSDTATDKKNIVRIFKLLQ